ncbi:hypothetical protein MLD38_006980 [Melastoma candidum]|uniref:Uncharacterized protein n=1 Tax=Melastoma candidum TaxID=119954 RepID=A0ACB9RQV9_9MYRT|nr:hypothetical protein MLD38_006980 [Melastoma candidum]
MGSVEDGLRGQLEDLQKQLGRKQKFENAVVSIGSVLRDTYASASPPLCQLMYSVVCRVATILKTRYTAPGFWSAGLQLFELAEGLVSRPSEKEHLKNCIAQAREQLDLVENPAPEPTESSSSRGYLFEGHLTVDPEPPRPQWLVQSELVNTVASLISGESFEAPELEQTASTLLQELIENIDTAIPPELLDALPGAPRAPPASKEVVAKLPVITLSEEMLARLGKDAECAVCREDLVVNDEMQELPCKHLFHPPCLKPWLDEHNSCPICRHELRTDDHAYESWKEREKEAEEERKGAANAVRGGEYMYV